jgi:hypothetical protein
MRFQEERTLLRKLQALKLRRMDVCDQIRQMEEAQAARSDPHRYARQTSRARAGDTGASEGTPAPLRVAWTIPLCFLA